MGQPHTDARGGVTVVVLGIDPGTKCGFALQYDGGLVSGVWHLQPKRGAQRTRQLVLWQRLEYVRETYGAPDLVCHEEVMAHGRADEKAVKCEHCKQQLKVRVQATNVLAAHVYAAIVGTLEMWCDFRGVRLESVPVGTLKRFATGDGRATKQDMVAWAQLRWSEQRVESDDQADALHVLDYAMVEIMKRREKAKTHAPGLQDDAPAVEF